jgi:hypothetical protein
MPFKSLFMWFQHHICTMSSYILSLSLYLWFYLYIILFYINNIYKYVFYILSGHRLGNIQIYMRVYKMSINSYLYFKSLVNKIIKYNIYIKKNTILYKQRENCDLHMFYFKYRYIISNNKSLGQGHCMYVLVIVLYACAYNEKAKLL